MTEANPRSVLKSIEELALDADIAKLKLTTPEKIGLQINRNFNKRVEQKRDRNFQEEINEEEFPTQDLIKVTELFEVEDARALPIIFCAYIDQILLSMYRREIPDHVPGGKAALFGSYGPFSDLSSRTKLAYCFRLIGPDLLVDIDRIRTIRNRISHNWDVAEFENYIAEPSVQNMMEIEKFLDEIPNPKLREYFPEKFYDNLSHLEVFRIRLIWIASRTTYEAMYHFRAQKHGLNPFRALYGGEATKWLGEVARISFEATRRIVRRAENLPRA